MNYAPEATRLVSEAQEWRAEREAVKSRQDRRRRRLERQAMGEREYGWLLVKLAAAGAFLAAVAVALYVVAP